MKIATDLVNRLGATLLQVLLALGTVTWAPALIPGAPAWLCWTLGVLVALVGVVVHVTGVSAGVAKAVNQAAPIVASTAEYVTTEAQKFANTNIDLNAPGHAAAQAAAPARSAQPVITAPAPQFDQPTGV